MIGEISLNYSFGMARGSEGNPLPFASTRDTFFWDFHYAASGCKKRVDFRPTIIYYPSEPLYLFAEPSAKCTFKVIAYDPDGVDDIVYFDVEDVPAGISTQVDKEAIEWGQKNSTVTAEQLTVTLTWNRAKPGEYSPGVAVVDKAGKHDSCSIHVTVVSPPEISLVEGPTYDSGINAYLMRLRITNPNSEQVEIAVTAKLDDSSAGSLRFGQGSSSVVVSPTPGGSEEVVLVYYPNSEHPMEVGIALQLRIYELAYVEHVRFEIKIP